MSLRVRLTIFYTVLVGVVLVLFGFSVFNQVEELLVDQFNQKLEAALFDPGNVVRATEQGDFALATFLAFDKSLFFQLWDSQGELLDINPGENANPGFFLVDEVGLEQALINEIPSSREIFIDGFHFQVMTEPLFLGDENTLSAVVQVGTSLDGVDAFLNDLRQALVFTGLSTMGIAAVASWLMTNRAMSPLATVTRTASEITRADDLSRRIPVLSKRKDEVGQLINTFNQTLERMEELFLSQRRFVADVGHELRTPLTAIKGNADLMRRVGLTDDHALDSMVKEIDRLIRMVGDLLLLAQAESGNLPLDLQVVELDTILLEVCQQAYVLTKDKKQLRIGEIDQVLVKGDQDRLKQVMLNLISNAIKYSGEDGEIEVRLGKRDGAAYLAIQDDGPGISEEDQERIFERFYRAEKSRFRFAEDDGKGFGLGLSIAYWIVYNHGGKIEVDSNVGEGSTFTVRLPLAEEGGKGRLMGTTLIPGSPGRIS